MDTYHFDRQIDRFFEQITDVVTMMLIVIIAFLVLVVILKKYYDFFSGLYKLNLRTGLYPRGICFGRHGIKYVYSPVNQEGHVAVVSKSGGGKTSSILIPTIRAWVEENYTSTKSKIEGTASYIIDISGDIVSSIDKDPSVRVFEPLDPSTPVYDVFGQIQSLESRMEQVDALETLSYILIPEEATQDAAIYYESNGRQLLQATLISLFFNGMSFLEICRTVANSTANALIKRLIELKTPEAIPYFIKYDDLTPQQMSNIYDAVHDALRKFSSTSLAHAFDTSRIDAEILTAASVEDYNLFFVMPDDVMKQNTIIVRVITEQILNHIAARPLYTGRRILLALDEFGSFGKLDLLEAAEKYRKRYCRLMILFQDINRIDKNWSHEDRESLFANMEYILCLGTSAYETQLFLANRIGKRYLKKRTYNSKTGVTVSEHFDYPLEPYRFGKCRWHLYIISNNEFMRLRKSFIPELHRILKRTRDLVKHFLK